MRSGKKEHNTCVEAIQGLSLLAPDPTEPNKKALCRYEGKKPVFLHFPRKQVLILDLNGSKINIKDLLVETKKALPNNHNQRYKDQRLSEDEIQRLEDDILIAAKEIKTVFQELHRQGIALCIVTNSNFEASQSAFQAIHAVISLVLEEYPDYIDLIIFDNPTKDKKPSDPKEKKKSMVGACRWPYANDSSFIYLGLDPELIKHFNTVKNMTALPLLGNGNGNDTLIQQIGLLQLSLKKAGRQFKDTPSSANTARPVRSTGRSASPPAHQNSTPYTPSRSFGSRSRNQVQQQRPEDDTIVEIDLDAKEETQEIQNPLLNPAAKVASLPFSSWFNRHFTKVPLISDETISNWSDFKKRVSDIFFAFFRALFGIYPFDGYDPATNLVSYAEGADKPEHYVAKKYRDLSFKLLFIAFLGLPSRAIKDYFDSPTITFKQVLKNLVGGIDWNQKTPPQKKTLQVLGILFKAVLIPALKLILWPFRLFINVLKIGTEVAPWLLTTLTYILYQAPLLGTKLAWKAMWNLGGKTKEYNRNAYTGGQQALGWGARGLMVAFFLLTVALTLATALLIAAHAVSRAILVIGRAITSPEKSVQLAYNYGSELKVSFGSEAVQRFFARTFGVLGAAASVLITGISWAICFPLMINYAAVYMPSLAAAFNAIVHSGPVISSYTAIQSTLATVGNFLHAVFGPAIAGLSNLIGVQITYSGIAAFFSVPFVVLFTTLGDALCNRWANWHNGDVLPTQKGSGYAPLGTDTGSQRGQGYSSHQGPKPSVNQRVQRSDREMLEAERAAQAAAYHQKLKTNLGNSTDTERADRTRAARERLRQRQSQSSAPKPSPTGRGTRPGQSYYSK